ncbi:unnamed protein product [Meganyctiphanes norvegica]|uniref:Uncharacterized protein n=1 Tax=Meganyctiphanes norvegica TaxID=48144 RepID=A0AAV2PIX1_MEGNR
MEADNLPNKDEVSTSTSFQHIPSGSILTCGNKNQESYIQNNYGGDSSNIPDNSINHQVNRFEQSVSKCAKISQKNNDDDSSIISDNSIMPRVNGDENNDSNCPQCDTFCTKISCCNIKSDHNSSYENPSYLTDTPGNKNCERGKLSSLQENQGCDPLFGSNCVENLKRYCDSEIQNENESLTLKSKYALDMCNDCVNCDTQSYQNNKLLLNPTYLPDLRFIRCNNISNCEVKFQDKDSTLRENSDYNDYYIAQNAGSESNLKLYNSEVSNNIKEISILSDKIININDINIDTTNMNNATVLPNSRMSSKTVTFERQKSHKRELRTPRGAYTLEFRKNKPPIARQTSLPITQGKTTRDFRRFSLSQWASRRNKPPIDRVTSLPIVDGVDEQHLWSEARSFNRSALLVLCSTAGYKVGSPTERPKL